jgi:FKBP-type peptidyl-prolyl cis-trans isomerase FklB
MKSGQRVILAIGLGLVVAQVHAPAEDAQVNGAKSNNIALPRVASPLEDLAGFKDIKEKASYAAGVFFGNDIKRRTSSMDLDFDTIEATIKDMLLGKEPKLTDQQIRETLMAYQQESLKKAAGKNHKAGDAFLAENKKKEGVQTVSVTTPDGTTNEMQYKVLTEGAGAIPKSTDTVSVNYRGTLLDGKEFDSSYKHGQPARFPVTGVIPGWTKALEMMKVGSKWQLFIPASLAYKDNPRPGSGIEPGSTLIFEVELLSIEAPPHPPSPPPAAPSQPSQPLTSDIIKVPSADEIKKGAKIEVIKAEDVERQIKAAAAAATNQPAK